MVGKEHPPKGTYAWKSGRVAKRGGFGYHATEDKIIDVRD